MFFWYYFRSSFLTVYRNEAYNIPLESYGLGATSPCWTLFEILCGLRAVSKTVRRMTSGSERIFAIFSKPLIGMKQMNTVGKISPRRIFFISIIFSNSLRFKSSFKFTKSRNSVFYFFLNFRYCFRSIFLTVCRNKACNMSLESYGQGANFSYWNVF